MWKYEGRNRTGEPVKFTHGSHNLEVVWTIVPAATLLFIAIYQMNAWANVKMRVPEHPDVEVEVMARQFEWRIRYPGADGELGTEDDLQTVNDLHLPYGEDVVLAIKSQDVLHSFFLPHMRVKQDVVPGMKQYVWFRIKPPATADIKVRTYDIVCAELCGWGHYKMRGQITVQSRADFEKWLAEEMNKQNQASFTRSVAQGE
jgi:cytochrome c oxidase subunit 2